MLHAQSVVDLLLKLRVRADLVRSARRCLHFHLRRYRRLSRHWYFAYAGFSSITGEVIRTPSFEIERGLANAAGSSLTGVMGPGAYN